MGSAVPAEAIQLIQEFEGCHRYDAADGLVHAYPDPLSGGEPWTIGWGTTRYPDGRSVRPGDAISREEADRCFVITLQQSYWEPISRSIPHWQAMNDPMRSALCSFAYNLGSGFYGGDNFGTISRCLRERRWDEVPDALLLYVNPGSAVEAGLRRRRRAEGDLWRLGLEQLCTADTQPPEPQPSQPQPQPPEAPPVSLLLEAITETFLKKEHRDSSELAPHQLVPVETGRQWKIEARLATEGHSLQVRLAYGAGDWWIYAPHWREVGSLPGPGTATASPTASATAAPPPQAPGSAAVGARDLAVPYVSQLNNRLNPYGSCNVTCVAMCLYYLGMPRRPGSEFEDHLYCTLEDLGRDRHNPYDLKYLIETFPGYKDIFRENGSFQDIRTSIDAGNPVIVHGYFTASGHIVVIRGYDESGFLVNDPYGEWFSSGYDTSLSGERLHYSCDLIARTCSPESRSDPHHIWYHTVFRL